MARKEPIILGIGLAGLGIWTLARKGKAKPGPPEEPAPPGKGYLYGQVVDLDTQEPIAGVIITVDSLETVTGREGSYSFELDAGEYYTANFEQEGYEPISFSAYIQEEQSHELNVLLVPLRKELDFYVSPVMETEISNGTILDLYWNCQAEIEITNNGTERGTGVFRVWDSVGNLDRDVEITLDPGETYTWRHSQWIDFRRIDEYRVYLQGNWSRNNYSEALFSP